MSSRAVALPRRNGPAGARRDPHRRSSIPRCWRSWAISALDQAIALSPSHAHYLSERGYLYQLAKDWHHALESFKAAEESVKLLADRDVQRAEHTRALRGQGYALVELGDLDAAAQKYQQSLALDPDDQTSRQELEDVNDRRAKRN